jgi:hypothetical protein
MEVAPVRLDDNRSIPFVDYVDGDAKGIAQPQHAAGNLDFRANVRVAICTRKAAARHCGHDRTSAEESEQLLASCSRKREKPHTQSPDIASSPVDA